jgi:hypothetical protein
MKEEREEDEAMEAVHRMRFCMCRKALDYGEKYIACRLGRSDVCNGWVHQWCARVEHCRHEELMAMTDFICEECLEDSDLEDERDKKKREEKEAKRQKKKEQDKEKKK